MVFASKQWYRGSYVQAQGLGVPVPQARVVNGLIGGLDTTLLRTRLSMDLRLYSFKVSGDIVPFWWAQVRAAALFVVSEDGSPPDLSLNDPWNSSSPASDPILTTVLEPKLLFFDQTEGFAAVAFNMPPADIDSRAQRKLQAGSKLYSVLHILDPDGYVGRIRDGASYSWSYSVHTSCLQGAHS